jgi:hypothetical protein
MMSVNGLVVTCYLINWVFDWFVASRFDGKPTRILGSVVLEGILGFRSSLYVCRCTIEICLGCWVL